MSPMLRTPLITAAIAELANLPLVPFWRAIGCIMSEHPQCHGHRVRRADQGAAQVSEPNAGIRLGAAFRIGDPVTKSARQLV